MSAQHLTGAARAVATIALAAAAGACSSARGDAQEVAHEAAHEAPVAARPQTATPVWEDMPMQVAGCSVQRLVDAAELELFHWRTCDGLDGCSEAVWNEAIIGTDGEIGRRTSVDDDGRVVHIGVRYDSDAAAQAGVVVTREDGTIELGLRVTTAGSCNMNIPSVGRGRFGVLITQSSSSAGPARKGGLSASLDDLSTLTPFEIDPLPAGTGPDEVAMGDSRWLWRFAPDQLLTFSNVDGTGATVFAKTSSSILSLGGPTAIGASFLFDVVERPDGGALQAYIGRSDGVAPVERFIAGSPQEWVGAPMFAHSHIGWQKGIGPKRVNEFEAVELWASTYAGDSAALTPYKVGDLPAKSWSWIGAGWGRYVTLGESAGTEPRELAVWDLEAKTNVSIVLPADRSFEACAGVTRSAVWVVPALVSSRQRGLLRFAL